MDRKTRALHALRTPFFSFGVSSRRARARTGGPEHTAYKHNSLETDTSAHTAPARSISPSARKRAAMDARAEMWLHPSMPSPPPQQPDRPERSTNNIREANRISRAAEALHEDLMDEQSALLKEAVAQMETITMAPGGGGRGSVRSQISQLSSASKLSEFLASASRPTALSVLPAAPTLGIGVAKYEFEAAGNAELSCRAGDMLTIIDQTPPAGWLVVRTSSSSKQGLVPRAYVEVRVLVPSEQVAMQTEQIKDASAEQAKAHQRDVVDVAVSRYLHCSVDEWRELPSDKRPKHLLRLRSWDGRKIE